MESENKNVFHPTHYNQKDRKECWDEMIEIFGKDAVIIFDCLNAYKYYYRKGLKDGNSYEQDSEKMENYMEHARKCMLSMDIGDGVSTGFVYRKINKVIEESED